MDKRKQWGVYLKLPQYLLVSHKALQSPTKVVDSRQQLENIAMPNYSTAYLLAAQGKAAKNAGAIAKLQHQQLYPSTKPILQFSSPDLT